MYKKYVDSLKAANCAEQNRSNRERSNENNTKKLQKLSGKSGSASEEPVQNKVSGNDDGKRNSLPAGFSHTDTISTAPIEQFPQNQSPTTKESSETNDMQPASVTEVTETATKSSNNPGTSTTGINHQLPSKEFIKAKREAAIKEAENLLKKIDDIKNLLEKAQNNKQHRPVLSGNINIECPNTSKIVRIFTSSTFTDTKQERNSLMERVYPKLKQYCQEQGYEFQVVDMRWGVRNEATDDQTTTELCINELKLCQKLSTGPNFVTFLSHKYGYRAFPRLIESTEFDSFLGVIDDDESCQLLNKWFKRDDNNVPPTHVLHSISDHIPQFLSKDKKEKTTAKEKWWKENETMQDALTTAARKLLSAEEARRYEMSVTELEITLGVLQAAEPNVHTCWFKRNFIDIDKQEPCYLLSRYKECIGDPQRVEESQQLLRNLKEDKLASILPQDQILQYDVNWNEQGMNPSDCEEHRLYIDKLCLDFEKKMRDMIDKGIKARKEQNKDSPLFVEVVEHVTFCQSKCEKFYGREDTLSKIKDYILGDIKEPLVLFGESGCGKTSIMASAAKSTMEWCNGKCIVMIRFIGTTPDSSSLVPLLGSLINQIRVCVGKTEMKMPENMKSLLIEFYKALRFSTPARRILLFLDSLDQFDPIGGVRQLKWLPKVLSPSLKIIVSTLPGKIYEFYPMLKMLLKNEKSFIEVPRLPENDVNGILNCWLEFAKRKVTMNQRQLIMDAFQKCPLPLFLKLSFDEACRWTSFMPSEKTVLQDTVKKSIEALFSRIEVLHGKVLVSRALGYLTISRSGLSESELEDILSCDEEVLSDVYMYWTPPIRRLPPLLLVRIKTDLQQYLVDRGADNIQVFTWYHRQFHETARERYGSDEENTKLLHSYIGDFFSGVWANGHCKQYTDEKGNPTSGDRHVSAQPLMFGEHYNLRKLNNLVFHRASAKQLHEVKNECLLNIEFLLAKLKATSLRLIMDDFEFSMSCFPEDMDLEMVCGALRLSEKALFYEPNQLLAQLINRFPEPETFGDFLTKYINSSATYLEADRNIQLTPGGELIYCLSNHTKDVDALLMTSDGKMVITGSMDKTIKTWNVKQGRLLISIDTPEGVDNLHLCCDESIIVTFIQSKGIYAYHLHTGQALWGKFVTNTEIMCVPAKSDKQIYVFRKKTKTTFLTIMEGATGDILKTIDIPTEMKFVGCSKCTGMENLISAVDEDEENLILFDIKKQEFTKTTRVFKKVDNDDDIQETMDAMVMTPDEKFIIVATMMKNDLIFVGVDSFEIEKTIPGREKDSSGKFHLTPDGKHLYFGQSNVVITYDLSTGTRQAILEHKVSMNDVYTMDGSVYVSIGYDGVVRVWDRNRTSSTSKEKSIQKGFENLDKIRSVMLLDSPRYILLEFIEKENKSRGLMMYDVTEKDIVRKIKLTHRPSVIPIDDRYVIVIAERKIKILDLMTGQLGVTFEGKVVDSSEFEFLKNKKELITTSRGRMNLKVYDVKTGKVKKIMKGGQTKRIEFLKVNKSETTACTAVDDGPLYVFDLTSYQLTHTINSSVIGIENFMGYHSLILTDDGYILISEGRKPPCSKNDKDPEVDYIFKIDIEGKKDPVHFIDVEDYGLMASKQGKYGQNDDLELGVDSFKILDEDKVISVHYDYDVRIFDLKEGTLLQRTSCHKAFVETDVVDGSPFILSYSTSDEENSFRLWNRQTYEDVAAFTFDSGTNNMLFSKDGKYIITTLEQPAQIVTWKIHGSETLPGPLESYPVLYSDKDLSVEFILPEDKDDDPNDPDTDVDEPEDDDDDDDIEDEKDADKPLNDSETDSDWD